ncbi:hypothetical protein BJY04DRAFT_220223 [Aspergillus karnatakaensis]|uniref:uncharacterized protein n=1 Tax=Aspergillus karnatakaensis TaxID=1810916 RepID=UPI003CCDADBE
MSRSRILTSTSIYTTRPIITTRCTPVIQARLNSGITKDWKGSSGEKHATHRQRGERDNTDPQTIASERTKGDREKNYGVGGTGTSDAATERGGRKNEREVKKEHPKAPEPVLGMNDERAQKGV